jgi:hypothetical protein
MHLLAKQVGGPGRHEAGAGEDPYPADLAFWADLGWACLYASVVNQRWQGRGVSVGGVLTGLGWPQLGQCISLPYSRGLSSSSRLAQTYSCSNSSFQLP